MKTSNLLFIILGAFLLIFGVYGCGVYNTTVTSDEITKSSWSEVENQYQRRSDLIGNLVETVKGYASHEQNTLTAVIEARSNATKMTINMDNLTQENLNAFNQSQGDLSQALGRLMMLSERYPELKADKGFIKLQDELTGTENRIAVSREQFNNSVQKYNTYIRKFPTSIVTTLTGFKPKAMFKADDGAKNAPNVSF